MNLFSELYIKHLARTLFFISTGVTSSIGQFLLTKNILKDEFFATIIAVVWAASLTAIYSYFVAEREQEFTEMKESFNYHRTLKLNNPIGAINRDYTEVKPLATSKKSKAGDITKVEFVHSMEPIKPRGKTDDTPSQS